MKPLSFVKKAQNKNERTVLTLIKKANDAGKGFNSGTLNRVPLFRALDRLYEKKLIKLRNKKDCEYELYWIK